MRDGTANRKRQSTLNGRYYVKLSLEQLLPPFRVLMLRDHLFLGPQRNCLDGPYCAQSAGRVGVCRASWMAVPRKLVFSRPSLMLAVTAPLAVPSSSSTTLVVTLVMIILHAEENQLSARGRSGSLCEPLNLLHVNCSIICILSRFMVVCTKSGGWWR